MIIFSIFHSILICKVSFSRKTLLNFRGSKRYQNLKIFKTCKDTTICLTKLTKKHTRIYKQMNVSLHVLKNFKFLYRLLPLKFNKEENETLQIKIG